MRRGATKVPKSNSMNEARMSEIPRQIGPQMCFELLFNPRRAPCAAQTLLVVREIASVRDTPTTPRVRPMGRDLRDGPRLAEGMAALG